MAGVSCRADDGEADEASILTVSRSELTLDTRSDSRLSRRSSIGLLALEECSRCNLVERTVSEVVEVVKDWLVAMVDR